MPEFQFDNLWKTYYQSMKDFHFEPFNLSIDKNKSMGIFEIVVTILNFEFAFHWERKEKHDES